MARLLFGPLVVLILALLLGLILAGEARAHDWYPRACCSDIDCAPLSPERVVPTQGGYIVMFEGEEYLVPYENANSSPDGRYHLCWKWTAGADGVGKRRLRTSAKEDSYLNRSLVCFWAPDGAV